MIVPTKRTLTLAGIAVAAVIAAGSLPIRSDSTVPMQGGHYKFTYMLTTAAAGAYQATAVTDGGTIKGSVVYTGTVPVKKIIPKDPEVCGKPHDEPQIVVGAGKGVKDAVVYLEGITKGKPMTSPAGAPEINNKNCEFLPESQVIAPGPIVIVNSDPVLHNTHAFYGKRTAINVALPNQGQRVTKDLPRTGIVRVECDEHGHMHATIYVADNPYHAVTGSDGAFTITDVPPGDYTLVAYQWHTGPVMASVTVKPKVTANVSIDLMKK